MARFRYCNNKTIPADVSPLEQYWMLSTLCYRNAWSRLVEEDSFAAQLLKLFGFADTVRLNSAPPIITEYLNKQDLHDILQQDTVYRNLLRLGERLNLNETDIRILTYYYHLRLNNHLYDLADGLEPYSKRDLMQTLAHLLDTPSNTIASALNSQAPLITTGLIELELQRRHATLAAALEPNDDLLDHIEDSSADLEVMINFFYSSASKAELSLDDFDYMLEELIEINDLIKAPQTAPKNILIYGAPGVGKTQMAKVLAELSNASLAVIPECHNRKFEPLTANRRLAYLNATNAALAQAHNKIILVDEADNILNCESGPFGHGTEMHQRKAALTYLLDNPKIPTLWICNDIRTTPQALLRRFSYIVAAKEPCTKTRQQRMAKQLSDQQISVSESWLKSIAMTPSISAAVFSKGLQVLKAAHPNASEQQAQHTLSRHFSNYLQASNAKEAATIAALQQNHKGSPQLPWRQQYICADTDTQQITHALSQGHTARLCLHGPAGTGKTQWATQLAKQLGKNLISKTASELLGPYVGQSEQLMAAAFKQAEDDDALLLIDEADTFFSDRSQARQNWEVSQTNQFLTSLENFSGLFIATTNRLNSADKAVMRRFDFKIKFDYLTVQQRQDLFKDLLDLYELPQEEELLEQLKPHTLLTPGDFAVIARKLPFIKSSSTGQSLLQLLQLETSYKQTRPAIGFTG